MHTMRATFRIKMSILNTQNYKFYGEKNLPKLGTFEVTRPIHVPRLMHTTKNTHTNYNGRLALFGNKN